MKHAAEVQQWASETVRELENRHTRILTEVGFFSFKRDEGGRV